MCPVPQIRVTTRNRMCPVPQIQVQIMAEVNLIEAVNLALARELTRDESVVVVGEDVGVNGGGFRATVGLQARFGPQRVIDTPLAQTAIAGGAVGMAGNGVK